jgi:hypothetical protein
MALSDFLTDGAQIPQGSAVKSVTNQTVLPDWYTSYAQNLLSGQQAISDRPYPTYQAPRVAGFTPDQQSGFDMTKTAATAQQPALNAALGATSAAAGTSTLSAAQPYYSQAIGMNPAAQTAGDFNTARALTAQGGATSGMPAAQGYFGQAASMSPGGSAAGDYGAARGLATSASGNSALGAAQPYLTSAAGMSGATAAQPYLTNASDMATGAVNSGGGLAAAQPYLTSAGQHATDVSSYMDPYTSQVVDRVAALGARNLSDSIMPGIEGRYIGAGQLGFNPRDGNFSTPSGMMTDTARAIRDTQDSVLNQQGQLLNQGYTQAQGAMQTDLGRDAQLASTAGQLGTAQQSAGLQGAALQSNIGSTMGNLTQAQQAALTSIGQATGGLSTADANTKLAASGQLGQLGTASANQTQQQQQLLESLGVNSANITGADAGRAISAGGQMANIGSAEGGLTQAQQQLLTSIGTNSGNLAAGDANRGLSAGQQYGALASLQQQLGLNGAAAVTGVGGAQQGLDQKNLDVSYADFLRQQGYPQTQIDNMLATFKGVASGVPSATQEDGIVPTGAAAVYQPSTASQIASGLTGLGGLLTAIKGL